MEKEHLIFKIILFFLSGLCIFVISFLPAQAGLDDNILNLQTSDKLDGIWGGVFLIQPLLDEVRGDQTQAINIKFFQRRWGAAFSRVTRFPDQLVWAKACRFENSTQMSLETIEPLVPYTHNLVNDSTCNQKSSTGETSIGDSVQSAPVDSFRREEGLLDVSIETIVIDPGHGGVDSGAVGRNGLIEREVTLDIANRLKKLLDDEKGIMVVLTRDKDQLIPLERRAEIANQNKADLFISIHTNASKKVSAQGFETYFLSSAKNEEARTAAALENSSLRFEQTADSSRNRSDVDFILMDLVQSEFLMESSDLAFMIQRHVKRELNIPNRGVNQAGFRVLNKTYMPAVLVEIAFISNPLEEALLRKESFRQQVARTLFESIKEFKQKYESLR